MDFYLYPANFKDGEWAESGYFIVKLGAVTNSVCDLCEVEGKLWAAYRNCVAVLDPVTLKIEVKNVE